MQEETQGKATMLEETRRRINKSLQTTLYDGDWQILFGAGTERAHYSTITDFCDTIQLVKELMAENNQNISNESVVVLNGLMKCLLDQLCVEEAREDGSPGPCLEKMAEEKLLELLVRWCCRLASVTTLWQVQLKFYLVLLNKSLQPMLQNDSVVHPLRRVLKECSQRCSHPSQMTTEPQTGEAFVQLLMQLCLVMSRDVSALELLLVDGGARGASGEWRDFPVFSYLVPFMHRGGLVGTHARDSLLLCLLEAANNVPALSNVKTDSSFCVMLALGLGGLFSELPTQLRFSCTDWCELTPMISSVPGLQTFVQSLQFCSSVVQISLPEISSQLVSLIRSGLLEQILARWLLQTNSKNTAAGVAYLNLILCSISEPTLLCEILRFILQYVDEDGNRLLHQLITNINTRERQLSNVTLGLFQTLLELNCEDVMLELALGYLSSGDHLQASQWPLIAEADLSSASATHFLTLIPSCCWQGEALYMEHVQKTEDTRLTGSPDVSRSMPQSSVPLEPTPVPRQKVGSSLVVSHRRLLSETHRSIQECAAACQSWSSSYASCQSPTTGVTGHDTYGQCGGGLAFSAHAMASTTSSIGAASSPLQHQQSLEYTAQSFSQLPSIGALSRPVCNDDGNFRQWKVSDDLPAAKPPSAVLFLSSLLDRLGGLLTGNSFNAFLVTSLITRLGHYPHTLLTSYLLNHTFILKPEVPSLQRTLTNLKNLIDGMSSRYGDFPRYLARARKTLLARDSARLSGAVVASVGGQHGHIGSDPVAQHRPSLLNEQLIGMNTRHLSVQPSTPTSTSTYSPAQPAHANASPGSGIMKKKRPGAEMLYVIVIFHEFLKEMASIAHEHSVSCHHLVGR